MAVFKQNYFQRRTKDRGPRSNNRITSPDVQVISSDGDNLGILNTTEAIRKAKEEGLEVKGAVMASDAFFPFRDGIDKAASSGIAAIIQPGGSIRDEEVIAAADENNIAMVYTNMRHFRH